MKLRRGHLLLWVIAITAVSVLDGLLRSRPGLLYNHSLSVPIGWYWYRGGHVRPGSLIAFRLPDEAHAYARSRGDDVDIVLLKPVAAIAGDHVSTLNNELRINGRWLCTIPTLDTRGRMLPRWHGCRVLNDGELFIYSAQIPNSFDSRFFGPVHTDDVLGVYEEVRWFGADPPDHPAHKRATDAPSGDARTGPSIAWTADKTQRESRYRTRRAANDL